jgi:hypothetical protein
MVYPYVINSSNLSVTVCLSRYKSSPAPVDYSLVTRNLGETSLEGKITIPASAPSVALRTSSPSSLAGGTLGIARHLF